MIQTCLAASKRSFTFFLVPPAAHLHFLVFLAERRVEKLKLYISELIGTFALVLIGVGSISGTSGSLLPIALAFGFVVAVMVAATGHVSGCHINPSVTIALLLTGKIKLPDAIAYIVSQLIGATLGAFVLTVMITTPHDAPNAAAAGATALAPGVTVMQGLIIEIVLTFFLVFVIFGTAVDMRAQKLASLFIGLTVVIDILVGGKYTGASLNPARSFGPALVGGVWANHWIYWVGPIIGAAIAGLLYNGLFLPRSIPEAQPEVRPGAASETP
jgi:MIP family channel proteins